MTDILDLDNWRVIAKHRDGDEYEIEAEYTIHPDTCPSCGVIGRLYRHGPKPIIYRDSPIRGHHVRILARAQRYKCRDCGSTSIQPMGGIQSDMRMTERCVEFIQDQCLKDTFLRIADHVGCDDKTVRTVAGQHIARLDAAYKPYLPEWMGIDETKIDGKQRCVITDVGARRPIDMLADRDKGTVAGWLNRFKDRRMVKGLAIDMWRPYKDVAKLMFARLPVVIDKFHVVRMANLGVDRTRIRLAKAQPKGVGRAWMRSKTLLVKRAANLTEKQRFNLDMWLDNEPDIGTSYRIKEAFFDIYDMPKAQAIDAYDAWAATVPSKLKADYKPLLTATRNWRTEILAYFDHPISNGYTEALNGVAKQINRAGRGYSFEVLRARLLFKEKPMHESIITPDNTYQRQAAMRRSLLAESGGRCGSCQGVFEPRAMEVCQLAAIVRGERTKPALLCATCHARFHTEGVKGHDSVSTP